MKSGKQLGREVRHQYLTQRAPGPKALSTPHWFVCKKLNSDWINWALSIILVCDYATSSGISDMAKWPLLLGRAWLWLQPLCPHCAGALAFLCACRLFCTAQLTSATTSWTRKDLKLLALSSLQSLQFQHGSTSPRNARSQPRFTKVGTVLLDGVRADRWCANKKTRWRTSRLPKMSEEGPGESQNTVCICCHAYPCHFCCHIVKPKTRTRTTTTTTTTRREHRLEAGVGFLQLCTWWLNQKSPFYTVIYSILWLWSMMFWRLLQEVKMPKKTFAIPQHLLEVQCILFFLSALSVGILRFEELAQSLDVLMLVCKSKLPWSHIDH